MALNTATPRDRLQRLVDLGRKTLRYWWLIALFAVVGGGLSFAFAILKSPSYSSYATLLYQEKISAKVLSSGQNEEVVQRNLGDKYKELLTAKPQLMQIIADPALDPFPPEMDEDVAVEKLRQAIKLESRGLAFRIVYSDGDRKRAKAVTEKLTKLLQDKDESLRKESAKQTLDFVSTEKENASVELRAREKKLNEFLTAHPEFVQDPNQPAEGGAIRKANAKTPTGNTRLQTLEGYRARLQARIDAPPDAPPVRVEAPKTPARIAAENALAEAQRELVEAQKDLANELKIRTAQHPAAIQAQGRVNDAIAKVRHAEAALPPEQETIIAPATPQDREKLRRELAQLEQQIADVKKGDATKTADTSAADRVVELESQNSDLRRDVQQQRERVTSLAEAAFRAQLDANEKFAEQGGRLQLLDPASLPVQPTGPGKKIFLMAGMVLFLSLGMALAIGLAVIDDRLYRKVDLDQLGIAVLGVIPPATARRRKKKPQPKRKATQA